MFGILIGSIFSVYFIPLKVWIVNCFIVNFAMAGIRLFLRDKLLRIHNFDEKIVPIAIYGAGELGAQLEAALRISRKYLIYTFLDDNPQLWGRKINDIPINPPDKLYISKTPVEEVFLAIPFLSVRRRREIVSRLEKYNLKVSQVPSFEEISSGKARIDNIRPIKIEDLLCREVAKAEFKSIKKNIISKVILITGAGGSIGSELCRQISTLSPKKLILLEFSEINLYRISNEIKKLKLENTQVESLIGDVRDKKFISNILKNQKVDIIFHASAFKHVPIVELNPIQGILNNVISTWNICISSIENNVSNVVLVSSDKAVRPTNVMGATKRLSEIIVQSYADFVENDNKIKTCFCMVRFGNVLGSSGSVVPLFESQIKSGGPITLTHKDIVRYFMSISEAAQLLIYTLVLSKGGEVFLLDMGKPIKIYDLAVRMITNSGLNIKNEENPEGDIEIVFCGLRPGEKLFEELLIDGEAKPTSHPLIFMGNEKLIRFEELIPKLNELEESLNAYDERKCIDLLKELVPEWESKLIK